MKDNQKKTITLTESDILNIVKDTVSQVLAEGFMQNAVNKVRDFAQKADNKIDDFTRGYEIKEGNPQSVEDLFQGDGWEIVSVVNKGSYNLYGVRRMTGSFGVFDGMEVNEMEEELNMFLNGKGSAKYVGKLPKYPGIEVFKVQ